MLLHDGLLEAFVTRSRVGDGHSSGLPVNRGVFLRGLLSRVFLIFVMSRLYRTFKPSVANNITARLSDKG